MPHTHERLADECTLSDNYHRGVMGGTGVNHIMFGFADMIWYSDGKGNPAVPPASQIENPNPQPGTDAFTTRMARSEEATAPAPTRASQA